ncbi:RNA 2',3'-cyclic phosphodiesterase [Pseudomonas sp. zfem005]|uniref:RNA 2',3'-cyclic phosphodiesterase n=1 Tax=Pseudomonas sp. zfem005 TaxID=3078200 RepID=UPI00160F770B|nr:RNA 2',3'-cyclic phosphodiesterase [Pseudomonas sp. zfem005]MDU9412076.1 RNA 2',3'-cyclic phosphodiesterase [Pseudomonas sp. zfem005]
MSTPPLRLFFALPCPEPLATSIALWREAARCEGKAVATRNLHLTLAFLGQQPRGCVAELKAIAENLAGEPFTLRLDQLRCWHNGLLHLAPDHPPPALLALAANLQDGLRAAGFAIERRPFHPHLTLARHCPHLPGAAAPTFDWPVNQFALFASENTASGAHYRALGNWPLLPQDSNERFTQ